MIYFKEDSKETNSYICPQCGFEQFYTESVEEVLPCPNCRLGETDEVKRIDNEGNKIYVKLPGAPSVDADGNPITYRKIDKGWDDPSKKPTDVPDEFRFYF